MVDKELMMRRHATVERSGKIRSGTLETGRSEFAQPRRVRLACNHRFQAVVASKRQSVTTESKMILISE
jgi:hypothetical protein